MAAQGVPDDSNLLRCDLRQRHQQIDTAHMIHDALHGAADVVRLIESIGVIAEGRIIGYERDIAALRQLGGVVQVWLAPKARGLVFADPRGLMETQHCRKFSGAVGQ